MATSCASRKFNYFQTKEPRKGKIVDLPSYRLENTVRFQPDDILGITVNVPAEQSVASDYNLPLLPVATNENSSQQINTGVGRQTYLVRKDGTIDFPVLGSIKAEGLTQEEMEIYLKQRLSERLLSPAIVTVRLLNFTIWLAGETGGVGPHNINKDHISLFEALTLGGNMSPYGRRDDIRILRPKKDGGFTMISVDISREDIIWSPYFYLHQNDIVWVIPGRPISQSIDISPRYGIILGFSSLAFSLYALIKAFK